MRFLELALKAIPEAATNPFAFLAYVLAVGAWLWVAHRTARLKVLGDQAKNLTRKDFADLIRREEGTPLPPNLDPEQWMRWQRQRNYHLAFLAFCFVLLTLAAITVWYAVRSQFAVAVVAATFSVPLFGLAFLDAWVVVRSNDTELARLRKEIDRTESELQTALNREKQQFGLVHEASGRASTLALYHPADPAIQSLADNLKRLVEEFKAHVGTKPLSGADGRRLRIAEGLVANAERRYADALALVPEQDAVAAFALARAQVEQAVKANQVRAGAFYGLQRWRDALAYYQHILELRPDDRSAALMAGNCFQSLGQLKEALDKYEQVITPLVRLVEHEGRSELANDLASSLNNRGLVYWKLGRYDDAWGDIDQAIDIRTRLVMREGRPELANDLASSLNNRGNVYWKLGRYDDAWGDFDQAINIYSRLVEREGRPELANDLARSLYNRGNVYRELGRYDDARGDFDQAIDICTRLVEREGRPELANDLARSLNNRGNALEDRGQIAEAIEDYDRAITIRTRLVVEEGRNELANDLALSLYSRGDTLMGQGERHQDRGQSDRGRADLKEAQRWVRDPRLEQAIRDRLQESAGP